MVVGYYVVDGVGFVVVVGIIELVLMYECGLGYWNLGMVGNLDIGV